MDNQGLLLPLDGRVFSATALALIKAGKFERGLARKLSQAFTNGCSVLEIGAAVGFLGLQLARARPDFRVALQEDNPSLNTMCQRIIAHNQQTFGNLLVLSDHPLENLVRDVTALVQSLSPHALLLADPRLSPQVLAEIFPKLSVPPQQIFLYGRLLEVWHGQLRAVEDLLAKLEYEPTFRFDATVAREFQLGGDHG